MGDIARSKAVVIAKRTVQRFMDDRCMSLAAAVAYYGFLSLFPLILFLIAIFGQMLQDPAFQDQIVSQAGSYLPGAEGFVNDTIDGVVTARGAIGLLSALTLLWSATGVFGAISQAVNTAWDVKQDRAFIQQNLLNLGLAVAAGIFLIISLALTGSFHVFAVIAAPLIRVFPFNAFWLFVGLVVPLLSTLAVFLLIYKILPNRNVTWKEALVGAALAAVLFEILKDLFGWYTSNLANYNAVYGSVGTVVVILTWTYFSSAILLLGAELSSVYAKERNRVYPASEPATARRPRPLPGGEQPSPAIAAGVGIATVGLIAFRTIMSVRAGSMRQHVPKIVKRG